MPVTYIFNINPTNSFCYWYHSCMCFLCMHWGGLSLSKLYAYWEFPSFKQNKAFMTLNLYKNIHNLNCHWRWLIPPYTAELRRACVSLLVLWGNCKSRLRHNVPTVCTSVFYKGNFIILKNIEVVLAKSYYCISVVWLKNKFKTSYICFAWPDISAKYALPNYNPWWLHTTSSIL